MICPYCDYKYGFEWDESKNPPDYVDIRGKHGDFWKSPLPMQRDSHDAYSHYGGHETINMYACPMCEKLFLVDMI